MNLSVYSAGVLWHTGSASFGCWVLWFWFMILIPNLSEIQFIEGMLAKMSFWEFYNGGFGNKLCFSKKELSNVIDYRFVLHSSSAFWFWYKMVSTFILGIYYLCPNFGNGLFCWCLISMVYHIMWMMLVTGCGEWINFFLMCLVINGPQSLWNVYQNAIDGSPFRNVISFVKSPSMACWGKYISFC